MTPDRRKFLGIAGVALGAQLGFGPSVASAFPHPARARSGGEGFPPLKTIDAGLLNIAYAEVGQADGPVVVLLHGWPYDIHSFADVTPLLVAQGCRVLIPYSRGFGPTRFRATSSLRNGQPAALAQDLIDFMDALGVERATLAGFDWGARTADIVAAIWPERAAGLVAVSGYLIAGQEAGRVPLMPEAELQWWYQYYFATERGRVGYDKNRKDFNRLIWKLASPKWNFDEATYALSAASFENPDHVEIVIHNYRWRLGLAEGEARYAVLDDQIAAAPTIGVPTITMEGDANGAPHPPPAAYRTKFTGRYEHREIGGGVGHNLPQEAPLAFAQAVLALVGR